jgi:hypothetical protein
MTDSDGNVLATSEKTTIEIEVEIEADTALAMPTIDAQLDEGELTLSGTGTPGSRIELLANGEVIDTVTVGQDGRWSATAELDAGEYALAARAVDAQGAAVAETEPLTFTQPHAEAAAPALTALEEGDEIESGTITLSGVGQPGATVEIVDNGSVVGTAVVGDDGTWTFAYAIEAGAHALAVQNAQDASSLSTAVNVEVKSAAAEDEGTTGPDELTAIKCPSDPPRGEDRGDSYVVARCEYMALIAERTNVSLADLIALNPDVEVPALIHPGQILVLPPRGE